MPDSIAALTLIHTPVTDKTTWSFVGVRTAQGVTGWGEATWVRQPSSLDVPFAKAQQALAGQAVARLRDWPRASVPSQAEGAIRSALEQAWWDIAGKQSAINAACLQGEPLRQTIPLYANINRCIRQRNAQGFKQAAQQAELAGFTHIKIAPFDGVEPGMAASKAGRERIEEGLERAAAARAGIGANTALYVDCHWRFDAATAAWVMGELAPLGVTWFECPLIENTEAIPALKKLRALAQGYGMRLAGLEELTHVQAFTPWLKAGAYDVVMPDVKYAGGIGGLLEISKVAQHYHTAFAPHNPNGPISHAASLVACARVNNVDRLEHQFNETPRFWQMIDAGFPRPAGGHSSLATAPGLGVGLFNKGLPEKSHPSRTEGIL